MYAPHMTGRALVKYSSIKARRLAPTVRQKPLDVAAGPVWILASAVDTQAFGKQRLVALEAARLETPAHLVELLFLLPTPGLHLDPVLLDRLHTDVVRQLRRTRIPVVVVAA